MKRMAYGDVDLNLLFVLERVLERESVTAAAEDLGLSPSATSRALQRLRDSLGDALLVRVGNRLVPTERARALLEPASRAMQAARDVFLDTTSFDATTATGAIALALGEELQHRFFPAIHARLQQEAPGIDLRVRNLSLRSAEEGRRDLLHLAVAPDLSTIPTIRGLPDLQELVQRPVYERHFVVVGSSQHWPEPPDLDAYVAAEHAIMTEEGGARGFMDDLLEAHGRSRRVQCSLSSFSAIARVVRTSRLLALMPAEVVGTFGPGLQHHPPPIPIPSMEMRLMWHPRYTAQPRHRFVREQIADVLRTSVTPLKATTSVTSAQ